MCIRDRLEADIEYLVVEGAMQYYRVTGDDDWLRRVLPKLETGINYMTSAKKRFDPEPVSYTHLDVYKRQVYVSDKVVYSLLTEID